MLSENFSWVDIIPTLLMPPEADVILQSQAALIIMLSFLFVCATLFLLSSWLISRDLQRNTTIMSVFFVAFLFGIIYLTTSGTHDLGWITTDWLFFLLIMIFNTLHYGMSSPSITAFLIPIVLATLVVNTAVGLSVTLLTIGLLWGVAFIEWRGWWTPLLPVRRDNLTFKAPFYTVIFTAVFVMISGWTSFLVNNLG